jgi:hypothetical protein
MKNELDNYYLQHPEPVKSCLLALRQIILEQDKDITEAWKYRMPFFCYKKKMFCYLWVYKKTGKPYMGIVDGIKMKHPKLVVEKRSRMAVLMIDVEKDLPIRTIKEIIKMGIKFKEDKFQGG